VKRDVYCLHHHAGCLSLGMQLAALSATDAEEQGDHSVAAASAAAHELLLALATDPRHGLLPTRGDDAGDAGQALAGAAEDERPGATAGAPA
jgi:hypothetical protein